MKENSISLQNYLSAGIRRDPENVMQQPTLVGAVNVRVAPEGLLKPYAVTNPFSTLPQASSYPWPQLIRGRPYHLLAYEDAIYRVDAGWNNFGVLSDFESWEDAKLQIKDATDDITDYELPVGTNEAWHFADFGSTWFMFKPDVTVFKANLSGWIVDREDPIRAQSRVTIGTGCAHRGRLITAGFDKDNVFDASAWMTLWNEYYGESPDVDPINVLPNHIDKNYVMWSTIGGGDTLALFYPELFIEGTRTLYPSYVPGELEEPLYLKFLKRNEMGWMPMESEGEVYKVMSLGKNIAVYTEDAVYLMPQVGTTFGLKKMLNVGVYSRASVGGTENMHTFMDVEGYLWQWSAGGVPTRLGFESIFSSSVAENCPISICIDEKHNDTYVNMPSFSGLLSPHGMSTITYTAPRFSEGFYKDGSMMVVGTDTDIEDSNSIGFATQRNDLQRTGLKKVTWVEVIGDIPSTATCKLKVQAMSLTGKSYVKYMTLEGSSLFRVDLSGVYFNFVFQMYLVDMDESYNITNLLVTYQADDNRFTRGTYVRTTG